VALVRGVIDGSGAAASVCVRSVRVNLRSCFSVAEMMSTRYSTTVTSFYRMVEIHRLGMATSAFANAERSAEFSRFDPLCRSCEMLDRSRA
jgi:hypothetical protein